MDAYGIRQRLPFLKRGLPKRVVISYVVDYLIIIVLVIAFFALDSIEPFHQPFSLRNYTLRYPYADPERVPVPLLFALVVVFPIVVIAVYTLVIDGIFAHDKPAGGKKYRMKDRLWELNIGVLGLLLSSGTAFVITSALKNATGKPRPDIIDRCKPVEGKFDIESFDLVNDTICSWTDSHVIKDAYRSFPSGHSSSSWGGLFYLSLYLAGKLHLLDQRGEVWKTFVVLLPTLGAALITISRIEDARHHPFDVVTGSLLGALCAWVAYRQYFPPLHEAWRKGRAHPIRSWATGPLPPAGARGDDERARDHGKEPMRVASASLGGAFPLEDRGPTAYHGQAGRSDSGGGADVEAHNVFRAQVQATERLRQQQGGLPVTAAGSSSVGGAGVSSRMDGPSPPPLPAGVAHARPAGAPAAARGHVDAHSWDGSSADSDEARDAYELRPPGYQAPPGRDASPDARGVELVDAPFGSRTAGGRTVA